MTTFLKFVHIAAIGVWSGGLIVLPFLFWQRWPLAADSVEDERLHRLVRFVYVGMASPAAFIAIGSGTALIFLQSTFREWFSLKMLLVGIMVMLHVHAGIVAAHLWVPDGRFGRPLGLALTGLYLVVITAIIWVVLAKPHIDSNAFATELFEPGALGQSFGDTKIPMP